MPVLLPPPMPRFSCSITRTSGNRSRTSSSVPSVEPWSTTITFSSAHGFEALLEPRQRVPGDDDDREVSHCARGPVRRRSKTFSQRITASPGRREQDRHHEEEEAAGERRVGGRRPGCPRKLTKNASRTPSPLTVNGTSMTRKSSGPSTM